VSDEGDNGLEYQHEGADLGQVYGDDASRQKSRPGQQEQAERPDQPDQPEPARASQSQPEPARASQTSQSQPETDQPGDRELTAKEETTL
jgi:hypothetical protein